MHVSKLSCFKAVHMHLPYDHLITFWTLTITIIYLHVGSQIWYVLMFFALPKKLEALRCVDTGHLREYTVGYKQARRIPSKLEVKWTRSGPDIAWQSIYVT